MAAARWPQAPGEWIAPALEAVHRAAVLPDDLVQIPRRMGIHSVRGAKFLRHRKAGPARTHGKDVARAVEHRSPNPHQPHRPDAQHRDGGAELQAELAHALKGCAHHARHHHRLLQADALGDARQVHVRVADVGFLHKGAAPVREVHARVQVVLMLLGHAVLGLQAAPNGHHRADDDPVPDVEVLHLGADLRDLAAHLVPNGLAQQIGQRGAAHGAQVRVARAGRPDQRPDQRARGAGLLRHGAIVPNGHGVPSRDDGAS